jgi:hypothetical protein
LFLKGRKTGQEKETKRKERIVRKLLVLLLLPILLWSCIPYFVNPVSDIRYAYLDELLIGTWVAEHEKGKHFVHIGIGDGNWMKFISQEEARNYAIEVIQMFVSKVGDRTLLNYEWTLDESKKVSGYWFWEYEIQDKDYLIFYEIDWEFVKKAVENRTLLGQIGSDDELIVQANSSEIRAFIASSPKEKLFPKERFKFKRLDF